MVKWARAAGQTMLGPLAAALSTLLLLSSAYGTSLVAKVDLRRIILAADTRRDEVKAGQSVAEHHYKDDSCKLSPLGSTAVAVAGNRSYIRRVATDTVPNWDALDDAKAAQVAHGYDVHAVAIDWAVRAEESTRSYTSNPSRSYAWPTSMLSMCSLTRSWPGGKAAFPSFTGKGRFGRFKSKSDSSNRAVSWPESTTVHNKW